MSNSSRKVALLLHDLDEGGMQSVCLRLLQGLAPFSALKLDLVLAHKTGSYLKQLPTSIQVIDLDIPFELRLKCLYRLVLELSKYLKQAQPEIILSNLPFVNFVVILAKVYARSRVTPILIEHTLPLHHFLQKQDDSRVNGQFPPVVYHLARFLYPYAQSVVAPSAGIAGELSQFIKLRNDQLKVIYNPVVGPDLVVCSQAACDHPWFRSGEPPVFLAVGRLTAQKDYVTLIRAFSQLTKHRPARLMILGDGDCRPQLEELVQTLGLESQVALPGFSENPYAYMSNAKALVLSSIWEILPTVLIEALSCGCPIIAADCDYGPLEILDHGKYGILVPVGDANAFAIAMEEILAVPDEQLQKQKETLKNRAQDFSVNRAIEQYLKMMKLDMLITRHPSCKTEMVSEKTG